MKLTTMAQIRPLNEALQKTAIDELHEVPADIAANLEALKTWIKQQPHLRARTDDQFLVAFLRGCKYSLQKAKLKLDLYYTIRTKFPDIFRCTNVDQPKFREALRLGNGCCYLPTPLFGNGPRICIVRCGLYPCDKYSIENILSVVYTMNHILMLEDDQSVVEGMVLLYDLEKTTAAHFFQMTPFIMKKMAVYAEKASPFRIKDSHFFKAPMGFSALFNMLKPMFSEKMQKRFFVYGNKMDSVYEKIPQKYWPKEYGGENGSIEESILYWENKFDEYRAYIKDEINYGTDEKLRCGGPIDFDDVFGLEGSFRKLNVD